MPQESKSSAKAIKEPYYNTAALEFPKGVLYADRRLDLCKMVVGPPHIGNLMDSLRSNEFVHHFLLGDNIIGPIGAKAIASFVKDHPHRIDTWYHAGNCIDGASLTTLVDAFVTSPAITNIWLTRNPLGKEAANDLFRLITQTPNLRTLDIDQTGLGDAGIAELFNQLANYSNEKKHPLKILYMNGSGTGLSGAKAIGRYLASQHCRLTSLYLSNNPLGSKGVAALGAGLKSNQSLSRLCLPSVGLTDAGAIHLFAALQDHSRIGVLDIGMAWAITDLGQAYNYLADGAALHLAKLIATSKTLVYVNLDNCAITNNGLSTVLHGVTESSSMLYFHANSIFPQKRDYASVKAGQEHARLDKLAKQRIAENRRLKYGKDMSADEWLATKRRWIVSDEQDVRKIDSVYRNRDMGLARRGLKKLDKWWDEGDGTLAEVASYGA
ncbi:RNI-like protein [Tothia fuscella]|uniref:RNI-like protein n=1 Tax=Tothia fuscella TaxID=1048955 RepID=A0A9P4U0U9_9PEZI|nr:RNI-like protein [Tothia fuscella]